MWRAFFLAIGTYLVILGVQCLAVERVNLKVHEAAPAATQGDKSKPGNQVSLTPSPWMPWTMVSTGIVTCLYSFTVPRRLAG